MTSAVQTERSHSREKDGRGCELNLRLWRGGKTRTKDKYRVVYTDHQRLELEKEFHYSRYITIRRKAELATSLSLSERQASDTHRTRTLRLKIPTH
ncbi:hypothetical protein MATL_G00050490 [Megalops atlanticus]|uniref:Homeobox domain-containing protein n=1 Tax=Megalops atlanticus TaxID=7932 RepID=A0A9D3TBR4_MEGAT|nr:hypothetical protein MATL_G00050490 [Megalops atlanticus]